MASLDDLSLNGATARVELNSGEFVARDVTTDNGARIRLDGGFARMLSFEIMSGPGGGLDLNGGKLAADEIRQQSLGNDGTTIAPGGTGTIGTTWVRGSYAHRTGAALELEVESETVFDVFRVDGVADFQGGQVSIMFPTGFAPPEGFMLTLIEAGGVQGDLGPIDAPPGYAFEANEVDGLVQLVATTVPPTPVAVPALSPTALFVLAGAVLLLTARQVAVRP